MSAKRLSPAARAVRWRMYGLSARKLSVAKVVEAMSVEGLPYAQIPEAHYAGVVAFRKLRADARERLVTRFFRAHGASCPGRPCVWCSL